MQTQQCLVQRGNAGNEVALILGNLLCIGFGGKSGDKDAAAALRKHGVHADTQTEAVEQRHSGEHLVAYAEHRVCRDDLLTECVKVLVGKKYSLGRTGRAAGIEDNGGVTALTLNLVIIKAVAAEMQEVPPADDGCIVGYLLDLAAFSEHIARFDGL